MKKNVCLLFALVLAIACTCIAFAAGTAIDVDNVVITEEGNNFFTVTGYVLNPVSNQQVTILVVPTSILSGGTITGDIADSDIAYINQVTINEENAFSIRIGIKEDLDATLYSLLLGGTDIAVSGQYSGPLVPSHGYAVTGTIVAGANFGSADVYNTAPATATLVELGTTVNAAYEDMSFAFEGIEDGTYTLKVARPGWISREVSITVNGGDLAVSSDVTTLLAGDVNGDTSVNATDVSLLIGAFGTAYGDANYRINADLKADTSINASDVSSLIGNFGKSAASYN